MDEHDGQAPEVGGFVVETEIGRGGFGVVYRARQLSLDRLAAIKVVLADAARGDVGARFAQECRAIGALPPHPNIVTVYSTGDTTDGRPYLAMQLLSGGSLADRLPLPAADVVSLGARLADGLRIAHEGGIIHRDVTPANVLFGDDGEPKLVDFGISTAIGADAPAGSEVTANVAYTAPEILHGEPATPAADVYGLGATLFAAVSGRTPFADPTGRTPLPVLAGRIVGDPVPDLRATGVPAALCAVIERCMAKHPQDRYASMAELRAALLAVGTSAPRTAWLGVPRRVALAVAAVLLLGAGVTTAAFAEAGDGSSPGAHSAPPTSSAARTPSGAGGLEGGLPGAAATSASHRPARTSARHGPPVSTLTHAPPQPRSTAASSTPTGSTPSHAPSSTPTAATSTPDRPPVLGPMPSVDVAEHQAASGAFTASDPDGGPLTFRTSGLPAGVTVATDGTISGSPKASAADVTTNYKTIRTQHFTITVTVTDAQGESTSGTADWSVKDTLFVMPDYVGHKGCNGNGSCHESVPNITTLGPHHNLCRVNAKKVGIIVKQSVAAGTAVKWGATITYTVDRKSC